MVCHYKKLGKLFALSLPDCVNACVFCKPLEKDYSAILPSSVIKSSINKIKQTLDAFEGTGVTEFFLAGADPCQLKYDLIEVIDYIYSKNYTLKNIQTHGRTFVDIDLVKALKKVDKGFSVIIPIYGSTREINDSIMRPRIGSAYDDAVCAIQNCLQEGLTVDGNTRILPQNINDLNNIIQLYKKLGVQTHVHVGRVSVGIPNPCSLLQVTSTLKELDQNFGSYVRNIDNIEIHGPQLIISTLIERTKELESF